jgi:hypothetical protein
MSKPVTISGWSWRGLYALSEPSDIASVSPAKIERTTRRYLRDGY